MSSTTTAQNPYEPFLTANGYCIRDRRFSPARVVAGLIYRERDKAVSAASALNQNLRQSVQATKVN